MRCPDCGAQVRNPRAELHIRSVVHRMGPEVKRRLALKQSVKEIAAELGLKPRALRVVLMKLGISWAKGVQRPKLIRGPRAAVPPSLEALAVKLEALGMVVEAAMTGRKTPQEKRVYVNGRRCALIHASPHPTNFADEAPAVTFARPTLADWEFLLVETPYGWLVVSRQEAPAVRTTVAVGKGFRGPAVLNWRSRVENWKRIRPVGQERQPGVTTIVLQEGTDIDSVTVCRNGVLLVKYVDYDLVPDGSTWLVNFKQPVTERDIVLVGGSPCESSTPATTTP